MNWSDIFIYDTTWLFAGELVIRVVIMFTLIILFLRFTGKRGVRQLSIFELTIILSLGSIAGDPMFTEDLPLIQALLIMSLIVALYRTCTWLMMKFQPFEDFLEGKPLYIVEEGMLVLEKIKNGDLSHDEFFAEMRTLGIEHLGQVRAALLETNGNLSVLLFAHEEIRFGLPLFPKQNQPATQILPDARYACRHCGFVKAILEPEQRCSRCNRADYGWSKALNNPVNR